MNLVPQHDFRSVLEAAQTEQATLGIHLRNGTILSGKVGGVGDHHFLLTHLAGKEFYDALILIEDISVIETRVRNS